MLRSTLQLAKRARTLSLKGALAFSTTTTVRKDFVQELYLKELRAYKAPPAAKDAHVGAVKDFAAPPTPSAPILPDLASELASYDAEEPVAAFASSSDAISGLHGEEAAVEGGAKEFLEFLEKELPKEEHHHH